MAHPKHKISKSRRDKRRTHYKAKASTIAICSNCQSPVKFHRVCDECGYYRGNQVIEKEAAV